MKPIQALIKEKLVQRDSSPDNLVFGEAILFCRPYLERLHFLPVGVLTALLPTNPSGIDAIMKDLQTCLW